MHAQDIFKIATCAYPSRGESTGGYCERWSPFHTQALIIAAKT